MCKVVSHPAEAEEGFSEEQEKALKVRKATGQTDLERWNDIWGILWPRDSESDIRNPCQCNSVWLTFNTDFIR